MGTRARDTKTVVVHNAAVATGIGVDLQGNGRDYILTTGFNHLEVSITAGTNPDFTVKCLGASFPDAARVNFVDFSAADTAANPHDTLEMIKKKDQSSVIDGDTGAVFVAAPTGDQSGAGTTVFRINVDRVDMVNFDISAWVAAAVTVTFTGTTNA